MGVFYKYYKIGAYRPIRAVHDDAVPSVAGATESPDPGTGELVLNMALISRLDGDDTWEISEEEFNQLLDAYRTKIQQKKST